MARIFLLGPSEWKQAGLAPTPIEVRRQLKAIFEARDHHAILMEDYPDRADEDLVEKFDGILERENVEHIVVYWPKGAKMQTTYDELLLLRKRSESTEVPPVWILHHEEVVQIRQGEFKLLEAGERSRYLEAVSRLAAHANPWRTDDELREAIRRVAQELQ